MAIPQFRQSPQIYKLPQHKYVDGVRWLPPISALDRFAVLAFFDADADSPSIELHSVNPNPPKTLTPVSSFIPPSRISSLKTLNSPLKPIVAASSYTGSIHILSVNPMDGCLEESTSIPENEIHLGPISCVDLVEAGGDLECVSVGEDGRVNLVSFGKASVRSSRVFDSNGLVSYTAAKWGSPSEFATGGYGFGIQWWDKRKPGGPVSQFKSTWTQGKVSGVVHSIDIHPSRKHICLAGGSSGTIFAWDLRWQQQPIILSGVGISDGATPVQSVSDSEVREIQHDPHTRTSSIGNLSSSRILPVMMCSEDGILAVIEQGEEPTELLAEPCAINSFDIDRQNPSDVISSLEWESIVIMTRK